MSNILRVFKSITIIFLLSLLFGCNSTWQFIESEQVVSYKDRFKVTVPGGWVQYTFGNNIGVFVTKDGPGLQWVTAKSLTHQEAVKNTDFVLDENTLPSDLARFYEAKFKVENSAFSIENSQDNLKQIDGYNGFEMRLDYKNERGLRYRSVVVGFVDEKYFYEVAYQAPVLYQFDLHLPTYDSFVNSFKKI